MSIPLSLEANSAQRRPDAKFNIIVLIKEDETIRVHHKGVMQVNCRSKKLLVVGMR